MPGGPPDPHPSLGEQRAPCTHPVGVPLSAQSLRHSKKPFALQSHVCEQAALAPGAEPVAQPVPGWHMRPCAHAGGEGGGGGVQTVVHRKCPVMSHVHEFVHPLPSPPPQPSFWLQADPSTAHGAMGGGVGEVGQISRVHLPAMMA